MFCTKCGAQLANDAKFCTNCGATIQTDAPVTPPVQNVAAPAPVETKERTQIDVNTVKDQLIDTLKPVGGFFKRIWANKKLSYGIIGGVALIIVLGIVLTIVNATGYKSALNNFVDLMNGDANKIEKVMPKGYWDYMDEEYGKELDDLVDDFKDNYDDMMDDLKDDFGRKIKYSYAIEEATKVDKDDVKDMAEALADQYEFIDEDDVKAAYEVEIELSIKGTKDDDSQDMDVMCVKIGSSWYLLSFYEYGDNTRYSFLAGSIVS